MGDLQYYASAAFLVAVLVGVLITLGWLVYSWIFKPRDEPAEPTRWTDLD
jgi:hypothetical protein